jgi:DNA-binding NarL/FixJ family response regulator
VKSVRVVLAEDNTLLRQGIERLIGAEAGLELVGTAKDLPALMHLVETAEPDVVVTDIRMPPTGTDEGVRAAAELRERRPDVGVVVLSQYANTEYAMALLGNGSAGRAYLLKETIAGVDELARAIRTVAQGGSMVDPAVVDALVGASKPPRPSDLDRLTARERETLAEMAKGKNNAAIAATLFLSERAVEKHTNSIFSKLGLTEEEDVNRRVKAVLIYVGAQPVAANG